MNFTNQCNMKLISKLRLISSTEISEVVISDNCSLGQALTMIESWCYDNGANYPSISNLWKNEGSIRVRVITNDNKYINIFDITDK